MPGMQDMQEKKETQEEEEKGKGKEDRPLATWKS